MERDYGVCGWCGEPAERFPSGRWTHLGPPCHGRGITMWSPVRYEQIPGRPKGELCMSQQWPRYLPAEFVAPPVDNGHGSVV